VRLTVCTHQQIIVYLLHTRGFVRGLRRRQNLSSWIDLFKKRKNKKRRACFFGVFKKGNAMSKRISAKYKIDRRLGENIWGRPKSSLNNKEYAPGQHGQRRKGKLSDFGVQLRAKQKLKGYYGSITEKQFRRIYKEASRQKGDTSENLIGLLESRLDAIVYRAKFVPTVFAARQFINHGHVKVNGGTVNIASYRCKPGDVVEVKEKSRHMLLVLEAIQLTERDIPEYVETDHNKMSAKFIRVPQLSDVPYPVQMEPNLVVEFYSR
jgi:small subunit ribosomal protein S4